VLFRLHLPSVRGEARALIVAQGMAASEPPPVSSATAD